MKLDDTVMVQFFGELIESYRQQQVVFKAKTQYDNMQVDIDVIKIHNFKFAGAFTLPAAADGSLVPPDIFRGTFWR